LPSTAEFIAGLGGAVTAWPLATQAQQRALPVVGYVTVATDPEREVAFRQGLGEAGYSEGRTVTVEYHILDGKFDRLPAVMADLVRRRVAVIAAAGGAPAAAARTATATIPIVFVVGQDPVKLGLVASLARPGGNATGFNVFTQETQAKRLSLLHELVPKAMRVGVLVNPTNPAATEPTEVREAAPALGLQIQVVNASTIGEINAAFAALVREHADALFVTSDTFLTSRRVQLATLGTRDRIPVASVDRVFPVAGGLMSYGTELRDGWRQVGVYTGNILKGAKARRVARPAGRQVRLRHQPGDRDAARHRGAPDPARARNRGDRMIRRRSFITLLGGGLAARSARAAGHARSAHRRAHTGRRKRSRGEDCHLCVRSSACGLGLDRWPQRADRPSGGGVTPIGCERSRRSWSACSFRHKPLSVNAFFSNGEPVPYSFPYT
jgi:putative ABC transport system substrate-binding protein